jgi:phosphoribosylglycinamide formyltransferase 1
VRVAAFASGRGSNLAAILSRIDDGSLRDVDVRVVISNRSDAGALELARAGGIRALHVSTATHPDPAAFSAALLSVLEEERVDVLLLAGYLKRLPPAVVHRFAGRVLNIHPALLPRHGGAGMYGIHVHEAVLESGDRETGVTVHLVDEEYDHGPVLRQVKVPVLPGDTPEVLAARVLEAEHDLYWRVVGDMAGKTRSGGT